MAINSTRSNIFGGRSLTFQELQILMPQNSSTSLINYINNGLSGNVTKNVLLSASRYFSYIQADGYT